MIGKSKMIIHPRLSVNSKLYIPEVRLKIESEVEKLDHKYVWGPYPPLTNTETQPLLSPLHPIL